MSETGLPNKVTPREDEELEVMEEDTTPVVVDSSSSYGNKDKDKAVDDNKEVEEIEEEVTASSLEAVEEQPYIPTGQMRSRKKDRKSKTVELSAPTTPPSSSSSERLNATATPDMITTPKQSNKTTSLSATAPTQAKETNVHVEKDKENSKPPDNANASATKSPVEEVVKEEMKAREKNTIEGKKTKESAQEEEFLSNIGEGEASKVASKVEEQATQDQKPGGQDINEQGGDGREGEEEKEEEEEEEEKIVYDVSWMHKLKGKDLLKEAEAIISTSLLCIENLTSPQPHWKEILGHDGKALEDTYITVGAFLGMWDEKFERHPSNLPAALCLRFSKSYFLPFQTYLKNASQTDNIVDRNLLIKRAWAELLTPMKVKPFCDESCLLNISSMISFLETQDELMIIAECHLARVSSDPMYMPTKVAETKDDAGEDETKAISAKESQPHLDPRNVELTPGESLKLMERMGIRNLGVSLFGAIQARVLSVFRNFDDQYCTVGELIDYCTERGKIPLLDEHTDANLTIEADKEQNDDDSENKIKDQASCLRDLLSTSVASPSILQHTQRLLKKTTGGKGTSDTIEKDALLKYLYEHFGLRTSLSYLNSLLYLVEEPSTSELSLIRLSSILKFCYPFGYTFKVRTVLGSFYYYNKFIPTGNFVFVKHSTNDRRFIKPFTIYPFTI